MGKTKVICFSNNKGGSGKSTTCSNVGYGMALEGKRVLLIDGDMQMNLTLSFFSEEQSLELAKSEKNLYHAIRDQKDLTDYIVHTSYADLDLIPSSTLMSGIEFELFTKWQREWILSKSLKKIIDSESYDYILIDAPPTLGGWVMNIMCAADYLVIPGEASPWGLFGLANMFEFFEQVRTIRPEIQLLGIAITKADERKITSSRRLPPCRNLKASTSSSAISAWIAPSNGRRITAPPSLLSVTPAAVLKNIMN